MYDLPYDNMTQNEALDLLHGNHTLTDMISCRYGWDYDPHQYQTTTVTEVRKHINSSILQVLADTHNYISECSGDV